MSVSNHHCHQVKTRLILWLGILMRLRWLIPTMTYTWYKLRVWDWMVGCETFRKWRYEGRCHFGCSYCLCSLLLYFFRSWRSKNGIGTCFNHFPRLFIWRWSFPVRQIRWMTAIQCWSVVGLMGSYVGVRWTVVWLFPFLFYSCMGICSQWGLHLKRGIM